jgi:Skp family chaperone for outer membrane proteins
MPFIRPALAAATLAFASLAAPVAAHAANPPIVIVDAHRVFSESLAGKDAQTKLKGVGDAINRELAPEAQGLEADQKGLGLAGKSQQEAETALRTNKALGEKYEAFLKRMSNFQQKQELRNREFQVTSDKAFSDVLTAAQPAITEVMRAHGASVVAESNSVMANSPDVDVTADVIAKLNQKITSVSVVLIEPGKGPAQPPR